MTTVKSETADELRAIAKRSRSKDVKATCERAADRMEAFVVARHELSELTARIDEAWKAAGSPKIQVDTEYSYQDKLRNPTTNEKPGSVLQRYLSAMACQDGVSERMQRTIRFLDYLQREDSEDAIRAFMTAEQMPFSARVESPQ